MIVAYSKIRVYIKNKFRRIATSHGPFCSILLFCPCGRPLRHLQVNSKHFTHTTSMISSFSSHISFSFQNVYYILEVIIICSQKTDFLLLKKKCCLFDRQTCREKEGQTQSFHAPTDSPRRLQWLGH